jgi:hypothetical protein
MRQVSGTYIGKHKKPVPFDVQIPSSWAELGREQAASVLEVLTYKNANKNVIGASLLALLFGDKWEILAYQDNEALYSLLGLTNFLLETQPEAKNNYPAIKLRRKKHIAPADDLNNLSFGEWCFAYQACHYYRLSRDPLYLDKLIAILYRPADKTNKPGTATYTGDHREVFNENLIDLRARSVADVQLRIKQSILAWFSAALYNIMQDRPHVFPQGKDGEEEPAAAGDENRTWFTVFRELLGPKWGTEKELRHANAIFILDALEEQQIELKNTR